MSARVYPVPVGPDCSVLHYAGAPYEYSNGRLVEVAWTANEPFEATITIKGVVSGRSAKYYTWTDEQGREFPMFAVDLLDVVKRATIVNGTVTARWRVMKRGQNYGIRMMEDEK